MSMWVGGRAVQGREDVSNIEILLLRKLENHTEPLMDAKEVPLKIKGNWRLQGKGF